MALLVDHLKAAVKSKRPLDLDNLWVRWVALTEAFQSSREPFPLSPEGEPVAVSVKLYAVYSKMVVSDEYQVQMRTSLRDRFFSGTNLWQQQ